MKTLVTGATGFVGSFLVEELVETDREVHCMIRRTSDLRWLRDLPVEFITWDLLGDEPPPPVFSDIQEVFHLAGLITSTSRDQFFRVNAGGVQNLLQALHHEDASVERFIHVSSLAASGPSRDRKPLSETDDCRPVSFYGKSKREGELRLLRNRNGYPYTIVRPPIVIGPRDTMVLDLMEMTCRDVVPKFGRYKKFSFVFVKDLVEALITAAETEKAENRTYNIAHPEPFEWEEFVDAVCEGTGRDPDIVSVPEGLLFVAAYLAETISDIPGIPGSMTRDKAVEMTQPAWISDTKRAREELGFRCSHDFQETIQTTVSWYRDQGWLPQTEDGDKGDEEQENSGHSNG